MRISKLQERMKKENVSYSIFANLDSTSMDPDVDMTYLAGYHGNGVLVVGKRSARLLVPRMEIERARRSVVFDVEGFDKGELYSKIVACVKKHGRKKIVVGIRKSKMTVAVHESLSSTLKATIIDISGLCDKIRQIKSKDEISLISRACMATDLIFSKFIKRANGFRTEKEAANFILLETLKAGLEPSFLPIVASGKNSSMPHHMPDDTKIKRGFCVIDFGVRHKGYCSDMTRTIYFGRAGSAEREAYELLLGAQKMAIRKARPGISCGRLHDDVTKALGVFGERFIHGLGHGVGVGLHELPNLKPGNDALIMPGMVTTIEPGIYFEGKFGIRIEDDVAIGNSGNRVLTRSRKELIQAGR